jgi:hypothetical protein
MFQDPVRLEQRHVERLARQRAPLELQRGVRRVAAQLVSALDHRRMQRRGAEQRM